MLLPDESVADRLSQALADYLEEVERVALGSAQLRTLRERYLTTYPDLAAQLTRHFEDEDLVIGHVRPAAPSFDRYADLERIGQGAMGVVYKAFDRELKRWVALKIPSLAGADVGEAKRIRAEAESLAKLAHRNIVRVFDVADDRGHPAISMELMHGGNLEEHLDEFRTDQQRVARIMVDIARAVHHAHQRGILHRDLKPSNILLETDERAIDHPYVSDFGLAKPIRVLDDHENRPGASGPGTIAYGRIVGTARYMSPEQANGHDATTLSDIHGLGGILYALLTGRPPYGGESIDEALAEVRDPAHRPQHPRAVHSSIDRTLDAVCMKCLEKDPADRYRSAEGLAKDLDRWLADRPTDARPLTGLGRTRLWIRRNPVGAGLVATLVALCGLAGVSVMERLDQPRRNRLAVASQTAELLEARLDDMKTAVESTVSNVRLGELLTRGDGRALQALIEQEGARHRDLDGSSPFETLIIVDGRTGQFTARWPSMDPAAAGIDFRVRDYYRGLAISAATGAYVSKVFRSVTDELFKFGVSAWIARGDEHVGAVVATVTTDARMGLPELENESFVTAILALTDPNLVAGQTANRPDGASDYVILLHPSYRRGIEPLWFPADSLDDLRAGEADDYEDPTAALGGDAAKYAGVWSASFAPVAGSDFIVMVQQRAIGLPGIR